MGVEQARFETLVELLNASVANGWAKMLLYVELEDGVVSPALFYEIDGALHQHLTEAEVHDELFWLQEVFGPSVRAFELEFDRNRFDARFFYADKFDEGIDPGARIEAAALRCFGHTNILYVPL